MQPPPFFTSSREKRLWIWAGVVLVAIYSGLFLGQPLARLFSNEEITVIIFILGMILVGITILLYAFRSRPGKVELTVLIGITAVYVLFFLRLGLPERSHLMEYSVLAIFIHKAITERIKNGKKIPWPALVAIVITFLIGVLDECLQFIMPNRVFDTLDIVFNGLVITMAIGSAIILKRIQNWRIARRKKS